MFLAKQKSFLLARQKTAWLASKTCVSKISNCKWVNNIVKIMLMTLMKIIIIIKIEKGEAYHLVPKSILLLNIRVIWKVNTALDLVQSFELNNDGQ